MNRERREIWRWFMALGAGTAVLVWLYALEPVLKGWGWPGW